MEQIRIIKEMRARDRDNGRTDDDVFPRYMVWENVPGAFSSNDGEDFRAVLEETVRVAEPTAVVPRYEGGRWTNAGAIIGDGWSVAWRTHDAQYWGVPQRRRRISLVADFGGGSAPEILFESESLRGDPAESGEEREGTAGGVEKGTGGTGERDLTVLAFSQNGEGVTVQSPIANAITTRQNPCGRGTAMIYELPPEGNGEDVISFLERGGSEGGGKGILIQNEKVGVLSASYTQAVFDARGNGDGNVVPTITGDHENRITDYTAVCIGNGQADIVSHITHERAQTLNCMHDQQAVMVTNAVCCGTDSPDIAGTLDASYYKGVGARSGKERTVVAVDCRNGTEAEINGTLQAKPNGGTSVNLANICRTDAIVRRLTPTECERLQDFPDGWTDIGEWTDEKGKKRQTTDSARYRALGNSVARPFWSWLLRRIMVHCGEKTMGSLFDGIGGFPLCWNLAGGETLWASEIEPFCIAVTKKHFGDEVTGEKGDWIEFFERG